MDDQQRLENGSDLMILGYELVHLLSELRSDRARKKKTVLLEEAPHLILEVAPDAYKAKPSHEH